ncbi:hypothetical protein CCMSSC00406_0003930 [Pleurotus cornucopiae]|uniref:Uncharacterized protein n=1 Tax=Pleurotus cornucopiae TaxID=5321 RepID=A0ACB7IRS3_PLECO|nr:hypothetical protein CCMSSC00406_0003930 [Pleurotus cornucopiae]
MPTGAAFAQRGLCQIGKSIRLQPNRCVKAATFDRYTTIRTFFRQQHTTSLDQAEAPRRPRTRAICYSTVGSLHLGVSLEYRRPYSRSAPVHAEGERKKDEEGVKPTPPHPPVNYDDYPRLFRRLATSLPHLQRPTRDDLLKVATGFWERARIRFKWFTIKSFRKFNADDISAFVTCTTFFSVVFAIANSLKLQRYIARGISDYLTAETGVTVIFESAIVPKWKDSRISFKNVYVSRRPSSSLAREQTYSAHKAAVGYDVSNHPANHHVEDEDDDHRRQQIEDDSGWAMYDLDIDSIDVTLSLKRWLDGKGLIEDAVIKGVRGVLDRRSVTWDPENPLDPAAFRQPAMPGDFELESLQLEDVLVTVYQPGGFRPYTASIFRADLRCFRKQWMFYDFLSAENIVGQFDNCLVSLHKPQSISRTTEMDLKDGEWARMSRIRIDGVSIDHLKGSTTDDGPISWITSGKVDAVFDIKFPRDPSDEVRFDAILGDIADAISTTLSGEDDLARARIPGQRELAKPPLRAPEDQVGLKNTSRNKDPNYNPRVIIDIDLRFRDVKAAVPIFTNDISYVNNALIRPIVAFMNANHTLIPIRCTITKDLSDFEGAWTMWETGLMDEISLKIYEALAYHVAQANMNKRIKTVGLWSLQMTASAVLSALRNVVDPMSVHFKEMYFSGQGLYDLQLVPGP